jgi:hypothetical protein
LAVTLELTDREAELLADILDIWEQENEAAEDLTIADRSLEMDQTLSAHHSLLTMQATVRALKNRLRGNDD